MDQKLLFLINRTWTCPALDRVMATASNFAALAPLLVLAIVLLLVFGDFRTRAFLICCAIAVGIGDGIVCKTLKQVVNRPRPHQTVEGIRVLDLAKTEHGMPRIMAIFQEPSVKMSRPATVAVNGRSFPSSHTFNNFTVATLAALFFRRGWLLYAPAALVGWSRIYTGSHWPSDVLVSSLLAIGYAFCMAALFAALWKKFAPRLTPALAQTHPHLLAVAA